MSASKYRNVVIGSLHLLVQKVKAELLKCLAFVIYRQVAITKIWDRNVQKHGT